MAKLEGKNIKNFWYHNKNFANHLVHLIMVEYL